MNCNLIGRRCLLYETLLYETLLYETLRERQAQGIALHERRASLREATPTPTLLSEKLYHIAIARIKMFFLWYFITLRSL
ncbi:MAG: hypothetical protein ACYTX0_33670 [Nostoc sp.]